MSPIMASYHISQPGLLPRSIVSKHLPGKEEEWAKLVNKPKPLQLLDLPLDILQAIIREVTHTNDLTSLALTHTILHTLVIPHIYSRFDIVWPDGGPTVESRVGVDALTYGLATLVMAHDVFGERSHSYKAACAQCGCLNFCQHRSVPHRPHRTRRGNHFAQFTRKFSLGNGPEDWVKEYLITKETGKMLGTLVALAVGRMRNLESFTWDMPTGILRDVWLALASLDDRDDGQDCRLERVWVRWHDNQDSLLSPPLPGPHTGTPDVPHLLPGTETTSFHIPKYPRVEFPTFSVLSPLKSLTVLDIDELPYIEELSVLIERSLPVLQELRIGLARHAQIRSWARPWEDRSLVPPPITHTADRSARKGGVLGILVSRFCAAFNDAEEKEGQSCNHNTEAEITKPESTTAKASNEMKADQPVQSLGENDVDHIGTLLSSQTLGDEVPQRVDGCSDHNCLNIPAGSTNVQSTNCVSHGSKNPCGERTQKLKLDVLELERVFLSISVLSQAFDWSRLHTLTILSCREHEQLWKALRKQFAPVVPARSFSLSKLSGTSQASHGRRSMSESFSAIPTAEYALKITRIHTDTVSATFLAFVKDTLAPDTLEYLFLQQSHTYKSTVTIDQIYKHAVRRHRGSLKKLLINSDIRSVDGSPDGNTNWRKWAISRDLITCITSGRMHLRELCMSIDYKDWHYFLQRLPNASTLRSLHINHIADYVHVRVDAREAAHQVLDVVALRPELELCYLGIQNKCFEIVESSHQKAVTTPREHPDVNSQPNIDEDDVSDDHDDHEQQGHDSDSDDLNLFTDQEDIDDTEDEAQQGPKPSALRLREILFYDDKISIFKARHGRL